MSLQSELTRLQANVTSILSSKDDIMTALASKGVSIPSGATLHDVPRLIGDIPGRAPEPEPADSVKIGDRWYHYVQIGNQYWIDENLDFKFDGCAIGQEGASLEPRANYYNNDEATYGVNGNKYGLLYNWTAVKYLEDHKSELIPGWHVPTTTEWDALATAVGGSSVAGTKLKSITGWSSGNGDDSYGFAAFPAGYRSSGSFSNLGSSAYFWTATERSSSVAYNRYFDTGASISSDYYSESWGFSVRLVKDAS